MDRKSIIKFIDDMVVNIPLTQTEMDELFGIKNRKNIGFTQVRLVYHTAINHQMYPVCPYCKTQITNIEPFTVDHKIPKSKGGNGRIENLQPMHRECNLKKGSEIPEDVELPEKHDKKHDKHYKNKKHKRRDVVRGHGGNIEDFTNKCNKLDQVRTYICHSVGNTSRGSRTG